MEWAIVALIAFQTIVLIAAAAVLYRMAAKLSQTSDQVQKALQTFEPKAQEIFAEAQRFMKTIQPVGEQLVDISIDVKRIVEVSRRTTEEVTDYINETAHLARRQTTKIDGMLTDMVKKTEEITDAIHGTVIAPLRNFSAIFSGVRAAFGYMRGERPHPDRERFLDSDDMNL